MAPSDDKNEVLKEEEKKKSLNDRLRESKDSILDETETPETVLSPQETRELVIAEIKTNIGFCAKTAQTNEVRYLTRVLRKISSLRRKLTTDILQELILSYFPDNLISKENLLNYLEELSKDEMQNESIEVKSSAEKIVSIGEEVEVFLHLLLTIYLLDKARFDLAIDCSNSLIARLKEEKFNKRTLDPLRASAYFYYSRSYEKQQRLSDIRSNLLAAYRTSTLRHDNVTQTTVLNLLLRNFISYNLYDQADKLLSKTTFKEASTTSNQFARYLFYTGKIKAIQLDYTEAYKCLVQAIRKCPQNTALGFRKIATKFAIIVQLLMGEIPEKSLFRQKGLSQSLTPYYKLTLAVRVGDLAKFKTEVQKYEEHFHRDKTYSLIQRLRHNVIKTGLKKINSSYSRISLVDVAAKLHLDNVQDAEFIVAKAIRDGVIDASIDHAGGFIQSKDSDDIYTTQEPLEAFHRRITFCMNIHNDAVIAMRFPQGTEKTKKEENSEDDRTQDAIITLDEESDDEEIF